jgi:hypothetical protein
MKSIVCKVRHRARHGGGSRSSDPSGNGSSIGGLAGKDTHLPERSAPAAAIGAVEYMQAILAIFSIVRAQQDGHN